MPGHSSLAIATIQIPTIPMPDNYYGVMPTAEDSDIGFWVRSLRHVEQGEDVHDFTFSPQLAIDL